jgi:hypothetical protein
VVVRASRVRDFQDLRHEGLVGGQHAFQIAAGAQWVSAHRQRLLNCRRQRRQLFQAPDRFANPQRVRVERHKDLGFGFVRHPTLLSAVLGCGL